MLKRINDPNEPIVLLQQNGVVTSRHISAKNAVSCVIDGLATLSLQNKARAGRYDLLEVLYEEYLSPVQDETNESKWEKHKMHWQRKESRVDPNRHFRGERTKISGSDLKFTIKRLRSYNFHSVDHVAAKRRKPKVEYKRCIRLGHTAETCTEVPKEKRC